MIRAEVREGVGGRATPLEDPKLGIQAKSPISLPLPLPIFGTNHPKHGRGFGLADVTNS